RRPVRRAGLGLRPGARLARGAGLRARAAVARAARHRLRRACRARSPCVSHRAARVHLEGPAPPRPGSAAAAAGLRHHQTVGAPRPRLFRSAASARPQWQHHLSRPSRRRHRLRSRARLRRRRARPRRERRRGRRQRLRRRRRGALPPQLRAAAVPGGEALRCEQPGNRRLERAPRGAARYAVGRGDGPRGHGDRRDRPWRPRQRHQRGDRCGRERRRGTGGERELRRLRAGRRGADGGGLRCAVPPAGGEGAADCAPASRQPAINALAASPWVTAVGGTTVDPRFDAAGNATGYGGEVVWNDGSGATGGGPSMFFAKPVWQTGPGVPADGARDVPDVALAASPTDPGFAVAVGGRGLVFGGTSVSAPIWAGMAALLVAKQGGPLGLLNPELYRLGAAQAMGGRAVFHDVTTGTNAVGTTPGFAAGPGFDLAT